MNYLPLLHIAEEAARAAGQHALQVAASTPSEYKSPDQIVTQADRDCQALIIQKIITKCPGHGFIGEEGEHGQLFRQEPAGTEPLWWVIDPIDGTRNYANKALNFAVSIALLRDGLPVVGVIYDPSTNQLFSATIDGPARRNGQPIQCRSEALDSNSQVAISGNYNPPLPWYVARFLERFVCMNLGSAALHYAWVAAGAYSAAFSLKVKLWDIAAGALICQRAGARVTDLQDQPVFPCDCRGYRGQPIPLLIAGSTAHRQLINLIQPMNDR